MSDKCPFCGALSETDAGSKYMYECKTITDGFQIYRGTQCYDRQLAHKDEIIGDALEVVRTYRGLKKDFNSGGCVCSDCQELDKTAADVISRMEKDRKEKP